MTTIGSVFIPFLLRNLETGERMRYILRAMVVPGLFMPMFLGCNSQSVIEGMSFRRGLSPVFTLKCRDGTCSVQAQ